ncbi:MAG: exodeoxyribonuclease VII large subunit [Gammaproteobacteria bacterium]|nr:exodeoxyribonuclease VII large subunit [Gammaproteobacteria bacterium]
MTPIDISQSEEIFTVTRLNREVRFILESNFPLLWIEGEISNFAAPNSGHWHFSLKDAQAQVRCAMFKPHNRKLNFTPKDGMHVMLKARISLYEGRGDFQLLAEHMEEVGEGKLQLAFEALKKRLSAAGLFDDKHKKALPALPKQIGVITSSTGAAIRDILSVLKRRFPSIPVVIYPTLVQGSAAAANIVSAIQLANQHAVCDVLILSRGGGSLEDLWPFNEEIVAQAIFQSTLPIISGIGHEVDFTISDFVADQRAPTPSAAAELCTPDSSDLLDALQQKQQRLIHHIKEKIRQAQVHLTWTNKQLQQQHPKRQLSEQSQRLDLCEAALIRLQNKLLQQHQVNLKNSHLKLLALTPTHKIHASKNQLLFQTQTLETLMMHALNQTQQQLSNSAGKLDTLSPLATLQRGYAIATKNKKVLRHVKDVSMGDEISLRLTEGQVECMVTDCSPD